MASLVNFPKYMRNNKLTQTLPENKKKRGGGEQLPTCFMRPAKYYTEIWQTLKKQEKLQINNFYKHGYKNPQQNTNKLNPVIYKKDNISWLSWIYSKMQG